MPTVPLYEAIYPRADLRQAGSNGEARHKLAHILEIREEPTMIDSDMALIEVADTLSGVSLPAEYEALQDEVVKILRAAASTTPMTLGEHMAQGGHR